jgi:hypothetical protein
MEDADGWTALHYAAYNRNLKCCQVLATAGAEIDRRNKGNETPLSLALDFMGDETNTVADRGAAKAVAEFLAVESERQGKLDDAEGLIDPWPEFPTEAETPPSSRLKAVASSEATRTAELERKLADEKALRERQGEMIAQSIAELKRLQQENAELKAHTVEVVDATSEPATDTLKMRVIADGVTLRITSDAQSGSQCLGKMKVVVGETLEVTGMQRTSSNTVRAKIDQGWITAETNSGKQLLAVVEDSKAKQPTSESDIMSNSALMRTETLTKADGSRPETLCVEIPPGVAPGDLIEVTTSSGLTLSVEVPVGTHPGGQIEVALPKSPPKTKKSLPVPTIRSEAPEPEPQTLERQPEPQSVESDLAAKRQHQLETIRAKKAIREKKGELLGADQALLTREAAFLNREQGEHPITGTSWFSIGREVKPLIEQNTKESLTKAIDIIADAWHYSNQAGEMSRTISYGLEKGQEKALMKQVPSEFGRKSVSRTSGSGCDSPDSEAEQQRKREEQGLKYRVLDHA